MEITISYFDKEDNEKEITVTVDVSAYFDGIGPYEYWGCRGYDKGQLCVDINDVSYDKEGLPQDEIDEIEKQLKSREFHAIPLGANVKEVSLWKDFGTPVEYFKHLRGDQVFDF